MSDVTVIYKSYQNTLHSFPDEAMQARKLIQNPNKE
jgi:hypothetical protein